MRVISYNRLDSLTIALLDHWISEEHRRENKSLYRIGWVVPFQPPNYTHDQRNYIHYLKYIKEMQRKGMGFLEES